MMPFDDNDEDDMGMGTPPQPMGAAAALQQRLMPEMMPPDGMSPEDADLLLGQAENPVLSAPPFDEASLGSLTALSPPLGNDVLANFQEEEAMHMMGPGGAGMEPSLGSEMGQEMGMGPGPNLEDPAQRQRIQGEMLNLLNLKAQERLANSEKFQAAAMEANKRK